MELQEKEKNEKHLWKVIRKNRKTERFLLEELLITNFVTFSFNPRQLSNVRSIFYIILLLENSIERHIITELWRVYETLDKIVAS